MKDALGHGSDARGGGEKNTATRQPWDYGKTQGRLGGGVPSNPHPDSATGRALVASGQGVQLQLGLHDRDAAHALAQGGAKSGVVPVHPDAQGRTWTGTVKVGRSYQDTGPHPTREAARDAARTMNPKAKSVSTGYGYHGSFHIVSHPAYEK